MSHRWDPALYAQYAGQRERPYFDLVSRVAAEAPRTVVDLGCGSGVLTATLRSRWPDAEVVGVDSSPEMVAEADRSTGVAYEVADLRAWRPETPVDVVVSNAALQWVPGHLELLDTLVGHLAPGGWLAFQVPGNFGEPSHTLRHELQADPRFADHLTDVRGPAAHDATTYLHRLQGLGCTVDAWETTYLHVLEGDDAVFRWVSGTSLRPTLQALPEPLRTEFAEELRRSLRAAYPAGPHGTVMPFRRVFVVARAATPGPTPTSRIA
ncbi:trans-aconitate 2-methyltransferase [Nocardioides caldifontis]|uniref:trans-aconitate 2-methyltransferase n=1 Tax=Nocardioides caldifontis TaxID=2588938 RepID=UPI0011DF2F66|nr:trans-aconitate 2-methyltransferase [Nocardioides caldifontis]